MNGNWTTDLGKKIHILSLPALFGLPFLWHIHREETFHIQTKEKSTFSAWGGERAESQISSVEQNNNNNDNQREKIVTILFEVSEIK